MTIALFRAATPHARRDGSSSQKSSLLSRIRALVLLGGSVRPSHFTTGISRSVLDLPLELGRSVLDHWYLEAAELARSVAMDSLSARIVLDRSGPAPTLPVLEPNLGMTIERDPYEFRGTAGILRDLCADYAVDDYIVVASAAQVMLQPLADLVWDMAATGAEASLVAHTDGTPTGLMLLKCATLRDVSPVGFVDLKEQALPVIAQRHSVSVIHRTQPASAPIRTLEDYIRSLRLYHRSLRRLNDENPSTDPYAEDWNITFSVVEDPSAVGRDTLLYDSVVLSGGQVESGAVLVRSVVGPSATVYRRRSVVDRLVMGR